MDFNGPYVLTQIICNYLFKTNGSAFSGTPILDVYKGDNLLFSSVWNPENVIWDESQGVLALTLNREIFGDMTIICYEPAPSGKTMLFRYWVHTSFLPKSNDVSSGNIVGDRIE